MCADSNLAIECSLPVSILYNGTSVVLCCTTVRQYSFHENVNSCLNGLVLHTRRVITLAHASFDNFHIFCAKLAHLASWLEN